MDISAATIERAMTLRAASRILTDRVSHLTTTSRLLQVNSSAIRRASVVPWIGGGASAPAKTCPICAHPILADDLVVSARARPTVHLLCWGARPATGATTVPAGPPDGAEAAASGKAAHTVENPAAP